MILKVVTETVITIERSEIRLLTNCSEFWLRFHRTGPFDECESLKTALCNIELDRISLNI